MFKFILSQNVNLFDSEGFHVGTCMISTNQIVTTTSSVYKFHSIFIRTDSRKT